MIFHLVELIGLQSITLLQSKFTPCERVLQSTQIIFLVHRVRDSHIGIFYVKQTIHAVMPWLSREGCLAK